MTQCRVGICALPLRAMPARIVSQSRSGLSGVSVTTASFDGCDGFATGLVRVNLRRDNCPDFGYLN